MLESRDEHDQGATGGLLFLLLSLAYGYYATEIPGYPGDEYEPFTASTLPYALAGIGRCSPCCWCSFPGASPCAGKRRLAPVFILLGLMVIYGLGLTWFGFVLSTIAFLMWASGCSVSPACATA
jgi:putative tricarboxylic transport membrane protein